MAHQFHKGGRPKELKLPEELNEFAGIADAIYMLAELPMTQETPGVHRDDLIDEIIGACRKWKEREVRSVNWTRELVGCDCQDPRDGEVRLISNDCPHHG